MMELFLDAVAALMLPLGVLFAIRTVSKTFESDLEEGRRERHQRLSGIR
ncbi:hypothetical protein [Aureimonas sp. Leaf454]|nr:hypothetical protein [Aureimonas sp. Leaf454]